MSNLLKQYGWNEVWQKKFTALTNQYLVPARVVGQHSKTVDVITPLGPAKATIPGRLFHRAESGSLLPVVGDFVALLESSQPQHFVVEEILPRKSEFTRKASGRTLQKQIVASNIDIALLVQSLDSDFSPRRLERYLAIALEAGAKPVVVLNKTDVTQDLQSLIAQARVVARKYPVVALNSKSREGYGELDQYLTPGATLTLLGSSGVGKSTIVNNLLGTLTQRTQEVRTSDAKGRHTTTSRDMFLLPGGALLIDTPGMREIQVFSVDTSLGFSDIASLAKQCKFTDCQHNQEPGCAVLSAIKQGLLNENRLKNYLKLKAEVQFVKRKTSERLANNHKQKVKSQSKTHHSRQKDKYE